MKASGDPWMAHAIPQFERDELFIRQANTFLDCIERGTRPICTLDEGVSTLRVNLAILHSAECGKWVSLGAV